jgi:hypothetical protein
MRTSDSLASNFSVVFMYDLVLSDWYQRQRRHIGSFGVNHTCVTNGEIFKTYTECILYKEQFVKSTI